LFLSLTTKESKKAYLRQKFEGLDRETASLLIDLVNLKLKERFKNEKKGFVSVKV